MPLRRNREFLLLWVGQTVSGLGSQISFVAYPLLVLAVTGSPAKAGVVGFAYSLPIALLALPAGALADRVDRKRLMIWSNLARGVALALIPVALALGAVPFALIVVVAAIDGSGFVVSFVTERGAVRTLVAPEQLGEAVVRNESRFFAAMLAGPPLGGLLFGIGRAIPFLADAVSYAASTLSMLLIRSPFQEPRDDAAPNGVAEGVRWLWRRPFFRGCALLFAGGNAVFAGLYLLIVVVAKRHGASSSEIGVMLGIAAAGGLAGALLAPSLRVKLSARRVLLLESWVIALALPCLLFVHNALLLGLVVAAAELVTPVTNSIIVAERVRLAPDQLQGRVQAAATMVSFSAAPVGPLAVGFLLQHADSTATILVLVGFALALALAVTVLRSFRQVPRLEELGAATATAGS